MVADDSASPMHRFIGIYHSYLYIFAVFGSADQIRFYFQAVGRRREAVTEIQSAVVENILYRVLHFLSQQFYQRVTAFRFALLFGFHFEQQQFHRAYII